MVNIRKCLPLPPPTESGRLLEITENFCHSPPPPTESGGPQEITKHLCYCYYPPPPLNGAPLQPFNMRHSFTVRAKYADDNTYASTSKDEINLTKVTVPGQLHAYNLHVNEHTTEEYAVPDATPIRGKDSWRKCKLLGSLIDTKEDIQRRK